MRRSTGLVLTAALLSACDKPADQRNVAKPQDPICAEGDAECGSEPPPPPPRREPSPPRPPREPRDPPVDPRGEVIKVEKQGNYYHATVKCRNGRIGKAGSAFENQVVDLAFNDCGN